MSDSEDIQTDDPWLKLAADAFTSGDNFYEWALRKQLAKNMDNFRSKHPKGSKYHTDAYKHRSKLFRPKTRSAIRRGEAHAAIAFFATADGVSVKAENEADQMQRLAAQLHENVVNYRLENTIPWFLTCIGAYQDAMTQGVVISHQHWEYAEQEITDHVSVGVDEETGDEVFEEQVIGRKVLVDRPQIVLEPVENIRIDPAASWIDPINSSPYVVRIVPMYVGDIKARMRQTDPKTGAPKWRYADDEAIASSIKTAHDSVRQSREGNRPDSKEQNKGRVRDFDIAWCHENYIRKDGREWVYWTLGTAARLTDPVPLEESYRHCDDGKRPLVMGCAVIETHKVYPAGLPELAEGLQSQANEIANLRIDNIRLALSPQRFVRRGRDIDYRSLTRAVPGGVVLMDDPNTDVREYRPSDVTGSSYQEQDRTNLDIDELLGTFSQGSVQSNRSLNETVGGLNLLSNDANTMSEYQLRVFTETWVEPVLRQLVKMERAYETSEVILLTAGQSVGLQSLEDVDAVMSTGELKVRVNVGFGATNPHMRVQRMQTGLSVVASVAPDMLADVDGKEVIKEVFGALGYKDGSRFFRSLQGEEDPRIQQLMQQVQQLTTMLEGKQMDNETKLQIADMQTRGRLAEAEMRESTKLQIAQMQAQVKAIDSKIAASTEGTRAKIDVERLKNERAALVHQMRLKAAEMMRANQQGSMSQVLTNDRYNMLPGVVG